MVQTPQKPDYTPLLALFNEDRELTLTNGLTLSAEAAQQLESVIDASLAHTYAAIPGGEAIELLNREDAFMQRLKMVTLTVSDRGTESLGAVHLKIRTFQEMKEHLAADAEAFKLYLMQQDVPNWPGFLQRLAPWRTVEPETILAFRRWLSEYYPANEHDAKIRAVKLYCQLARMDGWISGPFLDTLIDAMDNPLPARKRRR
jgi:hypothetical protein